MNAQWWLMTTSIARMREPAAAADAVTSYGVDGWWRNWTSWSVWGGRDRRWLWSAAETTRSAAVLSSATVGNSVLRGSCRHWRCLRSTRGPPWPQPRSCWPRRLRSVPSVWPRCSLSSTSCVGSGTRSWSVARWGRVRVRSRCDDAVSDSGWSGIPSRVPESGSACTSDAFSSARSRNLQQHGTAHIQSSSSSAAAAASLSFVIMYLAPLRYCLWWSVFVTMWSCA